MSECIMIKCGGCRRVVFAAVKQPGVIDRDTKREIADMVANGCTVEHVPAEVVRAEEWRCNCEGAIAGKDEGS